MCSRKSNRNGSCTPCQLKKIHRPWIGYIYKCLICENETRRESDLKRLVQTAHCSKSYKCQICKENFTRRDNLTRHTKSKHDANGRKKCRFCQKSISRKDAVKRHEKNCPLKPDNFSDGPDPEINVVD